jgi:hypothetical protein
LPLKGTKAEKDVSDFFRLGHTSEDLMIIFREMLDQLYEDTIALMKSCEIDFDHPPEEPTPLITINDVTIGAPGNLVCISGSEGSGKTNYLGGIISGAIKQPGVEIDTLGTKVKENSTGRAVLLYDTEQSEYQLYKNLTYILKRSQQSRPPEWFRPFCLVGISRNERMQLILESMDRLFYEYGGIHLVVIDGIGDLLGAVNDEEGSVKLIEELFRMAAIYHTVIICVLHMAPSGMKLRGHLGSEVQRKAAGILLIEKDEHNNSSIVKALKVRDGSPFDVPFVQFGWSSAEGRHVYQGELPKDSPEAVRIAKFRSLASTWFQQSRSMSGEDLRAAIKISQQVTDRTARDHVLFMKRNNIIAESGQFPGNYTLVSTEN